MRPLPYPDADHLYVMWETRAVGGIRARRSSQPAEYLAWTRATTVITRSGHRQLPGSGGRSRPGLRSPPCPAGLGGVLPLFGITPVVGRPFGRDAEVPGHGDVLLVSSSSLAGSIWWTIGRCRPHGSRRRDVRRRSSACCRDGSRSRCVSICRPDDAEAAADRSRQQPRVLRLRPSRARCDPGAGGAELSRRRSGRQGPPITSPASRSFRSRT